VKDPNPPAVEKVKSRGSLGFNVASKMSVMLQEKYFYFGARKFSREVTDQQKIARL